jgi:glycosyltransferase involved in cell wall biosynthesis
MKVDVLLPTYRNFRAEAYTAIQRMCAYSRQAGVEGEPIDLASPALRSSSLIHTARNQAIAAVRSDADYVLFVDDDMVPEQDALVKLLSRRMPIISALTTTREVLPPALCVRHYDREKDTFYEIEKVHPGKIIKGDIGVGTGFLVMSAETIDAVRNDYLEAGDWLAQNEPALKRMGVKPRAIARERRRVSETRKASKEPPRLFDFDVTHSGHTLGEDMAFCRRVLRLGIPIAVDTTVQVGHLGDFPYGPWNLGHNDHKELRF